MGLDDVDQLDRLVHEPARLVILTALASCASADFVFLQRVTRLTNGNLSAHLTKLSEARLVEIEKRFVDRKPNTHVLITAKGRSAVTEHWRRLEQLRIGARRLKPASS
ncbi:MAG TPA: transcriptional regulator [Candidatus Dormibacteraeota bacterium]